MFWWIVLALVVGIVFWVHYSQAMPVTDRLSVALDIIRTSKFSPANGFQSATQEDPTLTGWVKSKNSCIMHFRSKENGDINEVIDFASTSFHPGLIVHYSNGEPTHTDAKPELQFEERDQAKELLMEVRRLMKSKVKTDGYDGWHY